MSTINDSDLLLVERNGNLHQITYDQMSTLNDDDILLVERGGVQYKVEAQYVSTGPNGVILPSVEVLTPLNGAGLNDGESYTPMSSAYVSTDSTPIYYRHFPEQIVTVSGGPWVNENLGFDGQTTNYAELTGASGVVSQFYFIPQASWPAEYSSNIYCYASGGGTVEVLDENLAVLRSYALPTTSGNNVAVGIIRPNNRIQVTTQNQNETLYFSGVNGAVNDYVISGRVAFEFTDDTDLDKMVAPIIQTDANGDVKVPTTSTVDSTTTITGNKKGAYLEFTGNGTNKNYAAGPGTYSAVVGPRMTWCKANQFSAPVISDNVFNYSNYLITSATNASGFGGPILDESSSTYPASGSWNSTGNKNYIAEIGVAPKVLDIISYVGTDVNQEIPHSLGTKPGMIIVKAISTSSNWNVWHTGLVPSKFLRLDSSDGELGNYNRFFSEPTADNIYIGNSGSLNSTGTTYVAYVFAADTPGKVHCGSYVGNGNSGGNDVYIPGASPGGFLLIKRYDSAGDWVATTKNSSDDNWWWIPNTGVNMQGTSSNYVDFLPNNGFSLIGSNNRFNASGGRYVYLYISAALTGPNSTQLNLLSGQDLEYFTTGTPITSNLAASGSNISFGSQDVVGNDNSTIFIYPTAPTSSSNYFMDIRPQTGNKWLIWAKCTTANNGHRWYDSERHPLEYLASHSTDRSMYDSQGVMGDNGDAGYIMGDTNDLNNGGDNYIYWNFLAAPQFFDVQKYVGKQDTDSSDKLTINHDLGVEPGCIIIKRLNGDGNWFVWHHELGNTYYLQLDSGGTQIQPSLADWLAADANGFTFQMNHEYYNRGDNDYISYIFAKDTPYVKCGTYVASGNGTSVNVGFQPRWVMIKSISGSYDWMILDKNIPSNKTLSPNVASQSISTNNGYQFTSDGFSFGGSDWELNANGQEYIYIAIADESEGHPPNPPSSTTVTETPDPNTATMVVNAESFDVGATASAPALNASITSVAGSEGNTLFVDASTGTWLPGLYAKGTTTTIDAPGPDEITFTSQNQGTPAFSGVDATLASRTWTLESGTTSTGPWTVVDSYVDYDVLNSQDGATPWSSNKPNLAPNTFYRVKVQYNSTNAESVESVYNTFKTGDA